MNKDMKKRVAQEINIESGNDIGEILDKLLLLKEKEKSPSFLRKTIYVVSALSFLAFVILICLSIYKNNFTAESILSTLLAFFSIFISVFFYFKADETSTKFYDSSYKFMKEISVTLGKIEERFGEKLNSLNDKVSHLDRESKEATKEIEDKQEDKDRMINELLEKANLTTEERETYKRELEKKDKEISQLQSYRLRAEREAAMLRHKIERLPMEFANPSETDDTYSHHPYTINGLNRNLLETIIATGRIPKNMSLRNKAMLRELGCIDSNGQINIEALISLINNADNYMND